jgi:hypothetical protein
VRYVRALVVAVAVVAAFAPLSPTFIERWYSRGLYTVLQPPITALSSLVPFAVLDVAAGFLVVGAVIVLARVWRTSRFADWVRHAATSALLLAAVLYLWFLLVWGLNYRRLPLEQKLAYDQSRISRDQAFAMGQLAVEQVNALAQLSRERQIEQVSDSQDAALASAFAAVHQKLGGVTEVRLAQPKHSLLTWYFRRAAIDGMTDPLFLEIILTPDLLPFERPQTLTHEWAHLAGYADESEANFISWLTCVRGTPVARYSGWLFGYQHLLRVLPREDRKTLRSGLSPAVIADLDAAAQRLSRASPRISRAAHGAYDAYLRANRIEEGTANYAAVVRLMLGTSFDPDWTPQLRR